MAEAFVLFIGLATCALGIVAFVAAWRFHGRNFGNFYIPMLIAAGGLFCFAVGITMLQLFVGLMQAP
jgi:hypothetical protein